MEWAIFWTTFVTIFIAEMGDKTQFAALALSSQTKSTFSVWLAVVVALIIAGSIGVLAGRVMGDYLDPKWLKWLSGSIFIVLGLVILIRK